MQSPKEHHRPMKQHHQNFETNPRLKSHSNQQPVQTPNLEASGRGREAVLRRRSKTLGRRPISGWASSTRRRKPLQPTTRPPSASVVPKPRLTSASSSLASQSSSSAGEIGVQGLQDGELGGHDHSDSAQHQNVLVSREKAHSFQFELIRTQFFKLKKLFFFLIYLN